MFCQNKSGLVFGGLFAIIFLLSTYEIAYSNEVALVPSLSTTGEYDSNINFDRTNEIDDYLIMVSPSLNFKYTTELLTFRSEAVVDVLRYFDESEFDNENQYYLIGADYKLTERWNVSASSAYQRDTTLDSFLDETGLVTERKDVERFDIEGQTFYKATVLDEIGLGYRYRNIDFKSNEDVDYDTHLVNIVYNRYFNDFRDNTILKSTYEYRESDEKESDIYTFSVGWRHNFSETLIGRALLGVRYLDVSYQEEEDRTDFDDWGGDFDISLVKNWETTSGTIGYRREATKQQ